MAEVLGDLDRLLTTVDHSARSDADDIDRQAKEQAREIKDDARGRAEAEREEILDRARSQARLIARKRGARSSREARKEYLRVREELVDEVWNGAAGKLDELRADEDAYAEVLAELVRRALALLGPGEYEVASDEAGHALLTGERLESWADAASEEAGSEVALALADGPAEEAKGSDNRVAGGVVVREREGRRVYNATFSTRLELVRDEMREAVIGRLLSNE